VVRRQQGEDERDHESQMGEDQSFSERTRRMIIKRSEVLPTFGVLLDHAIDISTDIRSVEISVIEHAVTAAISILRTKQKP
jgi:hypothetical protein